MKQVWQVNWNDRRLIRSGIIPYTIINKQIYYAFGIEEKVAALGDFGGHKENVDFDCLDAAIREYEEECFSIFGNINRQLLQSCYVLEGKDTNEILFPLFVSENEIYPLFKFTIKFRKELQTRLDQNIKIENHEVQNIIWLSDKQLAFALQNPHFNLFYMYDKIYQTLSSYSHIIPNTYIIGDSLPRNNVDICTYEFREQLPLNKKYCFNDVRDLYLLYLTIFNDIKTTNVEYLNERKIEAVAKLYPNLSRIPLVDIQKIFLYFMKLHLL